MNPKLIFTGIGKGISHSKIKEFGRICIAIGRTIQKKRDYKIYKKIVDPIIRDGFKSSDKVVKSIAGKLLNGYKKFK